MGRVARSEYLAENHYYHVYSRFNSFNYHFKNDESKLFFIENMKEKALIYNISLIGYCIMSNHFHLICSIKENGDLSQSIGKLKESFTKWFHKKHEKSDGGLWRDRFNAILIENNTQALTLLRYVDLNPVRAGLVTNPWDYSFSSCRFYAKEVLPKHIDALPSYLNLSENFNERQKIYREMLKSAEIHGKSKELGSKFWPNAKFFGSRSFIEFKRTEESLVKDRIRLKSTSFLGASYIGSD